jgi:hypothetical protein
MKGKSIVLISITCLLFFSCQKMEITELPDRIEIGTAIRNGDNDLLNKIIKEYHRNK